MQYQSDQSINRIAGLLYLGEKWIDKNEVKLDKMRINIDDLIGERKKDQMQENNEYSNHIKYKEDQKID